MLIENLPQTHDEIWPEWSADEKVLAGKPGEQAIADKPVAKMRRKKAESPAIGFQTQGLAKAHPACPQRTVSVDDAFRLPGSA
jgi:hypothetical protein